MKFKKPIIPSINSAKLVGKRIVISGNIIEYIQYENPYLTSYSCGNKKVGRASRNTTEQDKSTNREKTLNRARADVRRKANANPELNKFFTLTFKDNITDLKVANYMFHKFTLRMNYYLKKLGYSKFLYLAVVEFQKRGAVHYHLLCNLPYITAKELEKIWGNGFVKINKIDNVDNVGAYITKYMTKDYDDERLVGNRCYFCSQGLKEPIEITDTEQVNNLLESITTNTNIALVKEPYQVKYNSDYLGEIRYTQLVLDKPINLLE